MAKKQNLGGRPRKEINFEELDRLCAIQCTAQEIADWFEVSVDTIERRIKENFEVGFAEYFSKKKSLGKISLRRKQFQLADKNAAMAIWLGKQWLDQKDEQTIKNDITDSLADRIARARARIEGTEE